MYKNASHHGGRNLKAGWNRVYNLGKHSHGGALYSVSSNTKDFAPLAAHDPDSERVAESR